TRPMVVIVVALEDCTIRVAIAPQKVPLNGVAAALASTVRSADPARVFRPVVMTVIPSRKRPTPPRIEIAVDMCATGLLPRAYASPPRLQHLLQPVPHIGRADALVVDLAVVIAAFIAGEDFHRLLFRADGVEAFLRLA